MYRRIEDFTRDWDFESRATLAVLRALSDEALEQRVAPDGRSLGHLAWHLAASLAKMARLAGLPGVEGPAEDVPSPGSAREIVEAYGKTACSLAGAVPAAWTDGMLPEEIPMYGYHWPRGKTLSVMVLHQAHHRGQMTVLMRQAGLPVPGCYGPSREEWAARGMEAPS